MPDREIKKFEDSAKAVTASAAYIEAKNRLTDACSELSAVSEKLAAAQGQLSKSEITVLKQKRGYLQRRIKILEGRIQIINEEFSKKLKKLEKTKLLITKTKSQLEKADAKQKSLDNTEKNLAKIKALENQKQRLEEKNSDLNALKAQLEHIPDSKNILEVCNLKKYFTLETDFFGKPKHSLKAVDGVSLEVPYGKTLGIVGESGCGKTTMGRLILRLHEITGGRVIFKGMDITALKGAALRKMRPEMQVIFQDPYSSLSPRLTVGEIIGEGVKFHKLVPQTDYREYVLSIMKKCGLQEIHYNRYPHEFSGGQRQRICIARALALKPDFIVCDEPVSALDVSIQAQIINLLKDLQNELNLTYLFISHDLSVIEHISDIIGIMYLGSMVESGDKEKIFTNPLHPYTKALFSAVPVPDPKKKMNRIVLKGDIPSPANPPSGCKFHTRCSECMEICKTSVPQFIVAEEGHSVACHLYSKQCGD